MINKINYKKTIGDLCHSYTLKTFNCCITGLDLF